MGLAAFCTDTRMSLRLLNLYNLSEEDVMQFVHEEFYSTRKNEGFVVVPPIPLVDSTPRFPIDEKSPT